MNQVEEPPETQTSPSQEQGTQLQDETQRLNQEDLGQVERIVRALIGVPIALSSIYGRHFSLSVSLTLGGVGLYLAGTALFHYCPVRHLVYWVRWKQTLL